MCVHATRARGWPASGSSGPQGAGLSRSARRGAPALPPDVQTLVPAHARRCAPSRMPRRGRKSTMSAATSTRTNGKYGWMEAACVSTRSLRYDSSTPSRSSLYLRGPGYGAWGGALGHGRCECLLGGTGHYGRHYGSKAGEQNTGLLAPLKAAAHLCRAPTPQAQAAANRSRCDCLCAWRRTAAAGRTGALARPQPGWPACWGAGRL